MRQQEGREQENKMGTMPVNRLLVTMSIPMINGRFDGFSNSEFNDFGGGGDRRWYECPAVPKSWGEKSDNGQ